MSRKFGYISIKESGHMEVIKTEGKRVVLKMIKEKNGCEYVGAVYLEDRLVMLIDDNGKLNSSRVNPLATILYGRFPADYIVGTAVIVAQGNNDLENLDLERAESQARKWMKPGKEHGYASYITVTEEKL